MSYNEDVDLRRNASGCFDPTAYEAIKNVDNECVEKEKFNKLLHTIFYICNLAGFKIQGRIVLINEATGRVWK